MARLAVSWINRPDRQLGALYCRAPFSARTFWLVRDFSWLFCESFFMYEFGFFVLLGCGADAHTCVRFACRTHALRVSLQGPSSLPAARVPHAAQNCPSIRFSYRVSPPSEPSSQAAGERQREKRERARSHTGDLSLCVFALWMTVILESNSSGSGAGRRS